MDTRIREYRRHADTCEELAASTKHRRTRRRLLLLAQQWRDLMMRTEMLQAIQAPEAVFSVERALECTSVRTCIDEVSRPSRYAKATKRAHKLN